MKTKDRILQLLAKGLSQAEIAGQVGVTRQYVNEVAAGLIISLFLPEPLNSEVSAAAEDDGVSVNEFIRAAVESRLKQ